MGIAQSVAVVRRLSQGLGRTLRPVTAARREPLGAVELLFGRLFVGAGFAITRYNAQGARLFATPDIGLVREISQWT